MHDCAWLINKRELVLCNFPSELELTFILSLIFIGVVKLQALFLPKNAWPISSAVQCVVLIFLLLVKLFEKGRNLRNDVYYSNIVIRVKSVKLALYQTSNMNNVAFI